MNPLTVVAFIMALLATLHLTPGQGREIQKRSFSQLGCLGVYDKAKFARLDRVCEECYQLYREPELQYMCRNDCFRNDIFTRCVDALLLGHEQEKLTAMVSDLYGKK
ncbi:Ion transport peptide-like [Halotydeus destructor]|nr:Ion transport peptide-like [Halotydeus destructor]